MGVPNSWMVYFMENPTENRMRTRGSPILGNLHLEPPQKLFTPGAHIRHVG